MSSPTDSPQEPGSPLRPDPAPGSPGPDASGALSGALSRAAGVLGKVDTHVPSLEHTAERHTLLDESIDHKPAIPGLDMQRQRDAVHARLFGRSATTTVAKDEHI